MTAHRTRATGPGSGTRLGSGTRRVLATTLALFAILAVAAPGAGLLEPSATRGAVTDLTLVTDATYTVLPDDRRVAVAVAITARNHTAETKTRKFYFDHAFLAVQPGSTGFRIAGVSGATVRVVKTTKDARLLRIGFPRLYSGKSASLRLAFSLPATGKGANPQVRVGTSLVTLPVWAFASDGTSGSSASVRFPSGWDVAVESGSFEQRSTTSDGGTLLATGPLDKPLTFFAFVSGQHPAVYADQPRVVTVGDGEAQLLLRAWEDDPRWAKRIGGLLDRALPVLAADIGLPWPHDEPLVVQEAVSREAGAYAGLFDPAANRIEVAYWASDAVVLHEAAHAWLNGTLVADRWAAEGFATWYAQRAAAELKVKAAPPELTEALRLAAIPLDAWAPAGAGTAEETYGYAASYELANQLAERVGPEGLAAVWAAAAERRGAYQPPIPDASGAANPESVDGPPGWRGLLDLFEDTSGTTVADLFRTWVLAPGEADVLEAREAARASYARTLVIAGDWALPRGIRDAMRAWDFDAAERQLADARTVLAQRTALESIAARADVALPNDLRATFEAGDLVATSARAEAERQAILAIETAAASRSSDDDVLSRIGNLGARPEQDIRGAELLFAQGDLAGAHEAADRAQRAWTGAWEEGRRRALLAVAVLATILVLGGALIGTFRRSRRRRRRMMAHRSLRPDAG